jgi:hypothetical protein
MRSAVKMRLVNRSTFRTSELFDSILDVRLSGFTRFLGVPRVSAVRSLISVEDQFLYVKAEAGTYNGITRVEVARTGH